MASPKSRPRDGHPGRALAFILVAAIGLVALMFGTGSTTPRLGIDLAGGTSVTLTAKSRDPKAINPTNMNTAVSIIQQRVNGLGVSEAQVQTQGNDNIIASIPRSAGQQQAIAQIGTTAKLYFRPVLAVGYSGVPAKPSPSTSPSSRPSGSPSATSSGGSPATPTSSSAAHRSSAAPRPSGSTAGRALSEALTSGASPSTGAAASPVARVKSSARPSAPVSAPPLPQNPGAQVGGAVPPELAKQFAALDCTKAKDRTDHQLGTTKDAIACDQKPEPKTGVYTKYVLGPVAVDGQRVTDANAAYDTQQGNGWTVDLKFNSIGAKQFATTTGQLAAKQDPQNRFAIVLDGQVVSAPSVSQAIGGGSAQIYGSFTQQEATDLANVLSYGALPLTFVMSDKTTVSPELGTDQLQAGLLAGAIGLALVVLYSLMYYRGLGLVSISGLALSALLTYALMCLLGTAIGFALNLPAVCGAIVAIGITADSFIVFFERIRDEMREGRSLRPAVQRGWPRARRTILVSDFVSFLAAAVLFAVSVGTVQGFAFTLGLTTLLDVVVVFLFTKPLITLLARRPFFSSGSPWSGLDPKRLGVRSPVRGGRRARGVVKEA